MICVSISDPLQLPGVVEAGAGLVELRLDLMGRLPAGFYENLPAGLKYVATCRPESHSWQERIRMLTEAIEAGAAYVDLEEDSPDTFLQPLKDLAAGSGCEVIISHHDFNGTPGDRELEDLLDSCFEKGADVAKIATKVENREEALRLLSLYRLPGRKVILGMGDEGRITRVAAPLLGGEFTFAAPGRGGQTAPGQLDFEKLQTIYRLLGS